MATSKPVFYANPIPPRGAGVLDGPEGHHAARVRRLRVSEQLLLTDGHGRYASATVTAVLRDRLVLEVGEAAEHAVPSPRIVVVQALAKGDRAERAVELLTELGVDEIVPWAAQRCIARWGEPDGDKAQKALARWSDTAREAAKQSRRVHFPRIAPLAGTVEVAQLLQASDSAFVLYESALRRFASGPFPSCGQIAVVVGPEGGITETELETFSEVGATAVRLGDQVLRTSTAGAAAAAVLLAHTRWRG
ncbi:MAG: 16S rRNA (uracil(1498)-N(3))-methyltransferase [Acidimicrobiales bacterium]|nr:MAG: 16S rRNA (uracil(1498)-N(3))-methyltransferase [Acidimicrobiales bacterium]